MRFGTMFKPNLLASKKAGFFVNKKNNTQSELSAENLRKTLRPGKTGSQERFERFSCAPKVVQTGIEA
jgi:hypothetical protein